MNASIRTRLIVLVLAAVLPVLLVAGWFLWEDVEGDYAKARVAATGAAQSQGEFTMAGKLRGKVALVTGGGAGIGPASPNALLKKARESS